MIDRTHTDAISLLLFLECRAVDNGGRVNAAHMNDDDLARAKQWNESGFIRFGRIASHDVNSGGGHWVILSDEAWKDAAALRYERARRMLKRKTYQTTEELRAST